MQQRRGQHRGCSCLVSLHLHVTHIQVHYSGTRILFRVNHLLLFLLLFYLTERLARSLDFCVRQVVSKIFNVQDNNCIDEIRRCCDVPGVHVMIEH